MRAPLSCDRREARIAALEQALAASLKRDPHEPLDHDRETGPKGDRRCAHCNEKRDARRLLAERGR